MTPHNWKQIDELFQAASELGAAGRSAYLDRACIGDDALRSEVESLLVSDSLEWDLLEQPAFEFAAPLLADQPPRLEAGNRLGHYEIIELAGVGGMGEVYIARDGILNRDVALKILPSDHSSDEKRLERFRREAKAASALNHPNIITVYELGSDGELQFIVTEFVHGITLRRLLKQGLLPSNQTIDIAQQTARALAAAHQAGIVHRDIKPENIMIRPDGLVKVLDFGLAKLTTVEDPAFTDGAIRNTDVSSDLLLGTARYMSPEQAIGRQADARSDLFSLGVVIYECLTGAPPFQARSVPDLIRSISSADPPPLGKDVDPKLAAIVTKLLQKDPHFRYPTAEELLDDISRIGRRDADRGETIRIARSRMIIALASILFGISVIAIAGYKFFERDSGVSAWAKISWKFMAPLTSPRLHVEPAMLGGRLYAVGGWNGCTPYGDVEVYDGESDKWTRAASLRTPRGAHGVGVIDGTLYAIGGSTTCGDSIATVEAYDPATNAWTEKSPLPLARANHVVVVADGKLFVIGGKSSDESFLNLTTSYDPRTDAWTEMAPIPTARAAAAAVAVEGIIYVIGGMDRTQTLATVEAYDPTTNTWTAKRPMLTSRNGLAVSEVNGIIYAIGGQGNRATIEAYDPTADIWTAIGEMPSRISSAHAASSNGVIYLVGGFDGANYLSQVSAFTPPLFVPAGELSCPRLQSVRRSPMAIARSNLAIGAIDGFIYVAGGYSVSSGYLKTHEAYDPSTDKWISKAPLPVALELSGSNSAVVGGKFYVIGGNASGHCSDLNLVYDPKADAWTTRSPMPTPRCHLAVISVGEKIYAIGGTDTSGSARYTTVEVYDSLTDTWSSSAPMPTGRWDMDAAELGGLIYLVGGTNPSLTPDGLNVVEAFDPISEVWTKKAPLRASRTSMTLGVLEGQLVVIGGGDNNNENPLGTVEVYDASADRWKLIRSMASTRRDLSGVTLGNKFYGFGGRSASDPSNSVQTVEANFLSLCVEAE